MQDNPFLQNPVTPPVHYKYFTTPNAIDPPNIDILQKEVYFNNFGELKKFLDYLDDPVKVAQEEEIKYNTQINQMSNINQLDTQIQDKLPNYKELLMQMNESIYSKMSEIFMHAGQAGNNNEVFISELDWLVHRFYNLCKQLKIYEDKLEIKKILIKETEKFQKLQSLIDLKISELV